MALVNEVSAAFPLTVLVLAIKCSCSMPEIENWATFSLMFGRLAFAILKELLPPVLKGVLPVLIYLSELNNSQVVPL